MIKNKLIALSMLALPMLALPTLASANLISNGDFEAAGTGWTTTPIVGFANVSVYAAPSCCGAVGTYSTGPGAAFFGWGDTTGGTLAQSFTTVVGQTYAVTFAHGALIGGTQQSMLASAIGSVGTLNSTVASSTGTTNLATVLSSYTFNFVADSLTTTLLFADTSASTSSVDGIVDNVAVNAVPVPASVALLVGGLGLLGLTARKNRNRQ